MTLITRSLSMLSIAALSCLGGGCATFVKFHAEGTGAANTFVRLDSRPQGVSGTLNTGQTFTTPANLVLPSDQEYTITFNKEGSDPIVVRVEPETNAWLWGNFVTLGFGCFFDDEKGADSTLTPDDILVTYEDAAVDVPDEDADVEAESESPEGNAGDDQLEASVTGTLVVHPHVSSDSPR